MNTLVAAIPTQRLDPEALVEQCLNGDRKAQFEVYRLYSKAMFNICVRIVGSYNEAQDVLQEAFVSAFRHLATFKRESTFGAWLKRIVINAAVQHMKRKRLDLVPLNPRIHGRIEDDDDSPSASHGLASDEAAGSYQLKQVHRAIKRLPDGYRMVLTLYLIEGYDHGEIAEIMGITESTSKSQFNRAKNKLKQILAEDIHGIQS